MTYKPTQSLKHLTYTCFVFTFIFICNVPISATEVKEHHIGEIRVFNRDTDSDLVEAPGHDKNAAGSEDDPVIGEIEQIHGLAQKVKDEGRLLDKIDNLTMVEYPIGVTGKNDDLNYAIILDHDYINTSGAFLTAYMSFEIPQNGKKLAFKAEDIPLTADGGIAGDVVLALVQDETVKIGNNIDLIIQGNDKTFITFDCQGFKSLTIDALIEFNSEFFSLENKETGKVIPGEKMATNFVTTVYEWNDLLVEVNLPPFQISPLKGFGFEVITAVFDMSDYSNTPNQRFPDGYISPYTQQGLAMLWQGVYIKEATIRMPPGLNNGERISIKGGNLIIDNSGFSGVFSANNLIPLEKGSLGGWAFSLETLQASVVQNSIKASGIAGQIQLPIMDDTTKMSYSAYIDQKGDFFFTTSMPKKLDVSLWKAEMTIDPSSTITIAKIDDEYLPIATLNGSISINSPIGEETDENNSETYSKGFTVSGLRFQEMKLSTKAPHFELGTWSLNEIGVGSDKLNGFSLTLSNIETIQKSPVESGIKFTARVGLMKDQYSAGASLSVLGKMAYETSTGDIVRQKWKYNTTQVHSIYLKSEAAVKIEGYFEVYRGDKDFGNGVVGFVKVGFPVIKIGVSATAQFGNINGVKYWYVDAFVNLERKPISMGGMALYGLGGGAYHHMRQEKFSEVVITEGTDNVDEPSVGASNSGIGYLPDKSTFLGLKAMVVIGTVGNPNPFNADVTFEVTFSQGMGIKTIALYGNGYIMSELDIGNTNKTAPVYCNVYIGFDFDNDVMHGNFKVFVNAAGGLVKGRNPGNLAGEMVIHYDKNDWYIHIGRPSQRVGLKTDLGFMQVENGSYFMIGTIVDPMPPPPAKVLEILDMEYVPNRDLEDMFTGKGFAFGSEFIIRTGDLQIAMFYADFEVGLGFDVHLGNYGDAYCTETGRKLGINGWYAQGQAYAYIEGEIGIRIKVFTLKVDAKILEIGAATLLEAKLPNPFWMRGTVGGYYNILNGKVSGKCNFQFEIGNQCTIAKVEKESSIVESLSVISELTPSKGETNVDVFNAPQAVFNYAINEPFEIPVDENTVQTFRVILEQFDLTDDQGNVIEGAYEWNNTNDVVAFNSHDILPGQTKMKLAAKVTFEEKISGIWQAVKVDGQVVEETMTQIFTTGDAPDYIPESNVAYNYPLFDQVNFYKDEYSQGYIQLKKGQAYLFKPGNEWVQKGRFTPVAGGSPIEFDFSYNSGSKNLVYNLPSGMVNNVVYRFELVNKPSTQAGNVDQNVTANSQTTGSGDGNTVVMKSKQAEGTLNILQEKYLFTSYFRTSNYNTFSQKIGSFTDWRSYSYNMYPGVDRIGKNFLATELFDGHEMDGGNSYNPLIQAEATGNNWLSNRITPLVYDGYPLLPEATIDWRDNFDEIGIVPVKAITKDQHEISLSLTENEKTTGSITSRSGRGVFIYYVAYYAYYDFFDIRDKLANTLERTDRINTMLSTMYPTIQIGIDYPVQVKYVLPGINKVTSTETINIEL